MLPFTGVIGNQWLVISGITSNGVSEYWSLNTDYYPFFAVLWM